MPTHHQATALPTSGPAAPTGPFMKPWLQRALRTTDIVAGVGEDARGLVLRSGGLWLVAVMTTGVVAWIASSLALPGLTPALLGAVGLGLVLLGACLALLVPASAGAGAGLFAMAAGIGSLVASLNAGVLQGTAPVFAACFAVAEALALVAWLAKREAAAAVLAVVGAAATTGAFAWVLDAGFVPATPWGVALGGALAILISLHARWAEGAVPLRHGTGQLAHAAASRWLEGPRGFLIRLIGFFVSDDDFFSPPST